MVGRFAYDLMYRWWAPWDAVGVRGELRALLSSAAITPQTHPRAIDLGCGTGANVVFLAENGFDVTGVDFSRVAIGKAEARARRAGVAQRCHFVLEDLTAPSLPASLGTFDVLIDFGTLDDLRDPGREAMARNIRALAEPGAVFLLWCFFGAPGELPAISLSGPSRMTPTIQPGEVERRFAASFDVERVEHTDRHTAWFQLRRRGATS